LFEAPETKKAVTDTEYVFPSEALLPLVPAPVVTPALLAGVAEPGRESSVRELTTNNRGSELRSVTKRSIWVSEPSMPMLTVML
jgi:hypothetical protein